MSKLFNHFIDGRNQEGTDRFPVINPATGDIFGEAARGTTDDIDNAVDVARKTFRASTWRDLDGRLRGNLLRRIGKMIRKHAKRLASMEVTDAGKTVGDAEAEIELAAQIWDYYGDLTQTAVGTINAVPAPDQPPGRLGRLAQPSHPQRHPPAAPAAAAALQLQRTFSSLR